MSRDEKHFHSSRQPTEQHYLDEMIIAENGPLIPHVDEIPERTMNQHWWMGLQTEMVNGTFSAELTTHVHIQETAVKLSENCSTKSLNYHSCKTVHVNYDIF